MGSTLPPEEGGGPPLPAGRAPDVPFVNTPIRARISGIVLAPRWTALVFHWNGAGARALRPLAFAVQLLLFGR